MPTKNPATPTESDRPKPSLSGPVVALRTAVGWLLVVVLGAVMGVGVVSAGAAPFVTGAVLGLLLAALLVSAFIHLSGRRWLLFPAFLATGLCVASVAVASEGYLAVYGTRLTATVVSSECHKGKGGGLACTARLRRPDGTMLDTMSVADRMYVGQTMKVDEDPAGILAVRSADEMDPAGLPAGLVLFGITAVLLAGLFALAAWLGLRRPRPKIQTGHHRPGRGNRGPTPT